MSTASSRSSTATPRWWIPRACTRAMLPESGGLGAATARGVAQLEIGSASSQSTPSRHRRAAITASTQSRPSRAEEERGRGARPDHDRPPHPTRRPIAGPSAAPARPPSAPAPRMIPIAAAESSARSAPWMSIMPPPSDDVEDVLVVVQLRGSSLDATLDPVGLLCRPSRSRSAAYGSFCSAIMTSRRVRCRLDPYGARRRARLPAPTIAVSTAPCRARARSATAE